MEQGFFNHSAAHFEKGEGGGSQKLLTGAYPSKYSTLFSRLKPGPVHPKELGPLYCKQTCCFRRVATRKINKLHKLQNSVTVFQWMWPQWTNLWPPLFIYLFTIVQFQAGQHGWLRHFFFFLPDTQCNCVWLWVWSCSMLLSPAAWLCLATLHCIIFAWTQQWCTCAEIEKMSLGECLGQLPSSVCIIPDLFWLI